MFSLTNILNLFFLSIPLVTADQCVRQVVRAIRRKQGFSTYWLYALAALAAILFALYYYDRILTQSLR